MGTSLVAGVAAQAQQVRLASMAPQGLQARLLKDPGHYELASQISVATLAAELPKVEVQLAVNFIADCLQVWSESSGNCYLKEAVGILAQMVKDAPAYVEKMVPLLKVGQYARFWSNQNPMRSIAWAFRENPEPVITFFDFVQKLPGQRDWLVGFLGKLDAEQSSKKLGTAIAEKLSDIPV